MTYTAAYLQSLRPGTHRIAVDGSTATDIANVSFYIREDGRLTASGYRLSERPGWRNTSFLITEGDAMDAKKYRIEEV